MSGSASYLEVLRTPQALRVFLPALLGRLSFAMVTLALIFAVQESTGSFALAGAATGAFGLANVLASPFRARLVDRWGQRLTLNALAVLYALGLCGLGALTATTHPPGWLILTLAGLTGLVPPPLGPAMRVLWGRIAEASSIRVRAYSVDAVAEELLFTTGPLIVAAVIALSSPTVALFATAGVAFVGTLGMTSSAVSRSHPSAPRSPHRHARPLRQPGFVPVLGALLGVGIVLGVVEVAAPAYAQAEGSATLAGVLLASFAAGSAVGGLGYGRRAWKGSLARRLVVLGLGMALLTGLLAVAPSVVLVGLGLAAVGFFLAPSLVTGYLLADELTATEVRTEASSWINTAVNAGAALAAAGAGVVVDAASTRVAFVMGAATALLCLLAVAPFLNRKSNKSPKLV